MQFDLTRVGYWTDDSIFEVTEEQTKAYAAATNDTEPSHLDGSAVPVVFAVVPPLVGVLTKAVRSVAVSEREGYDTRSLHGEQDLFIERPIRPRSRLRSRAVTVGVHPKSSGTVVIARTETRDDSGRLLNYQYFTNFIRGVRCAESVGEFAPTRELPVRPDRDYPLARGTVHVDKDQSYRYAEASGDHGTYHVNEEAARSAGFPGLILHGLCTMAFAARVVAEAVCRGESDRIRRFAVRFAKPVHLDQDLMVNVWSAGQVGDLSVYSFEMTDETGDPVIKLGLAHVVR